MTSTMTAAAGPGLLVEEAAGPLVDDAARRAVAELPMCCGTAYRWPQSLFPTRASATLGSGEFFGEMALLSGRPRQADVVPLTYCRLLVLRKVDFERFLAANSEAKATISRIAEERLSMNQQSGNRAAESVSS